MEATFSDHNSFHYSLSMQTILDNLSNHKDSMLLYCKNDAYCLENIRFFQTGLKLQEKFLYLVLPQQMDQTFSFCEKMHYLLPAQDILAAIPVSCSVLSVGDAGDPYRLFNEVQDIFEKYHRWDEQLHAALHAQDPIDELMESSLDIFNNPIFTHDQNFYILSSPRHASGMSTWVRDSRTGRTMVPFSLVQEFKTDLEYLHTLGTHGASMFSKEMRGYRIMYINLWNNHIYQGRICINELQSPLFPSHYDALNYLARFVEISLQRFYQFRLSVGKDIREFLAEYVAGTITNHFDVLSSIELMGWKRHDKYICFRLENIQNRKEFVSSASTLEQIEHQLSDGSAYHFEGGINVVANLSIHNNSSVNVISSMSIILREGLFKMGTSYVFSDFLLFPQAARQAKMALEMGKKSGSMIWCYRFDDYFLPYIMDTATAELTPLMLCSRKLLILQDYDKENNTDLYHTLDVYLNLERNVLQTAKALFIHRSTLFYRIDRIEKLTKCNLDDPDERLKLIISFKLLSQES